jgi:predicted Zn-dependent protease with MMP-like domain
MHNISDNGAASTSLETMEDMVWRAFNRLPEALRLPLERLSIHVLDAADRDMLASVGLDDPFDLSGLYVGVPLIEASHTDPDPEPARVYLFRRTILAEWEQTPGLSLEALVEHVLIHEIAHHYGYSDEEIDAILDATP